LPHSRGPIRGDRVGLRRSRASQGSDSSVGGCAPTSPNSSETRSSSAVVFQRLFTGAPKHQPLVRRSHVFVSCSCKSIHRGEWGLFLKSARRRRVRTEENKSRESERKRGLGKTLKVRPGADLPASDGTQRRGRRAEVRPVEIFSRAEGLAGARAMPWSGRLAAQYPPSPRPQLKRNQARVASGRLGGVSPARKNDGYLSLERYSETEAWRARAAWPLVGVRLARSPERCSGTRFWAQRAPAGLRCAGGPKIEHALLSKAGGRAAVRAPRGPCADTLGFSSKRKQSGRVGGNCGGNYRNSHQKWIKL